MKSENFSRLASIGPFCGVSCETLERVFRGTQSRQFAAGTLIAEQGVAPDFLDVLLEGSVRLIGRGPDGRETVVQLCQPVDCIFLAAVLTDAPCLVGALAVEPVKLLSIPSQDVRRGVASDHRLALNMMGEQARQARTMVRRIKNLNLRNAKQRLGCYLIALGDRTGSMTFALPVPKNQVAIELGLTPESVSRAFASLQEYGVSVSGRTVKLRNPELMRAECIPDPLIDRLCGEPPLAGDSTS
ncbi:MAG: cyclic nucleotide-binding domain-containing protein [Rhodospirillaceae bacterium]|nr:cyclic nucleotide-binding domain-containing protein [Rhodospirillaceae bacterium]